MIVFSYYKIGDSVFSSIQNYLNDKKFKLNICDQQINIVNYLDIITLEDNRIAIKYEKGLIVIKGQGLVLNKLLEQEILVSGKINSVEFE